MNVRTVSIICPLFNEEKFIERCILSILEQDYPQDKLEVLLIDGRSTDHTADIVRRYAEKHPFIKLLDNPERVVPYALNKGLEAATGEVIMRIDGHCTYPTNYISELVRYLYELDADNVGGVWNTQPAKDTAVCHAIALASSHPFGVGGSMHKIGASKIMETDTVPFGCYKREVFEKTGRFDTDLVRNQDDEFNIRQFFPLLFLLCLFFGGIISIFSPLVLKMYVAMLLLYLVISLVVGAMGAIRTRRFAVMLIMPYIFLNIHLSYGFGYLRGIFKVLGGKSFNVKSNR